MDAIITPSMSLLSRISKDFPNIKFELGSDFHWSPLTKTVFYAQESHPELLHELAHALLGHKEYTRDIKLLEMEQEAWEYARENLAPAYGKKISDEIIDAALDTYRDWLHDRSVCPSCSSTGLQVRHDEYKCLACYTHWKVNEARTCTLRRYKIKSNTRQ